MGGKHDPEKGHWTFKNKSVMPIKQTYELITHLHKLTHLSSKKMRALLDREESIYYLLGRDDILQTVADKCKACAQVNAGKTKLGSGVQYGGIAPVIIGRLTSPK